MKYWRPKGAIHKETRFLGCYLMPSPVTVVERSKAITVFALSEAGIVGSNSTQGMHVCMRFTVFIYR